VSGDHNQYQKPEYVDRRQWKYDPMTGEPLIDGWPLYSGLPQKPVAWGIANTRPTEKQSLMMVMLDEPEPSHMVVPLYTAPPQRKPWDNQVLITDEYERGFIDGMQKQMQSSVDKAVNKMAKREWQGLTDKEIKAVYGKDLEYQDGDYARFARAIEAKLKEKNK
jgi:hypothetical protein